MTIKTANQAEAWNTNRTELAQLHLRFFNFLQSRIKLQPLLETEGWDEHGGQLCAQLQGLDVGQLRNVWSWQMCALCSISAVF